MNDDQRRRLREALQATTSLSYEQAYARLYEVVMAERAGYDIEVMFPEFVVALDVYPALAEAYQDLHEAMAADDPDVP